MRRLAALALVPAAAFTLAAPSAPAQADARTVGNDGVISETAYVDDAVGDMETTVPTRPAKKGYTEATVRLTDLSEVHYKIQYNREFHTNPSLFQIFNSTYRTKKDGDVFSITTALAAKADRPEGEKKGKRFAVTTLINGKQAPCAGQKVTVKRLGPARDQVINRVPFSCLSPGGFEPRGRANARSYSLVEKRSNNNDLGVDYVKPSRAYPLG